MKRQDDRNYVGNDADGFVPKITVRADGAKKQADDLVYQGSLQGGLTPVVALEGAAVLTNVLGYVEDINAVVTPSEGDKYLSKDDGDYVLAYWNGTEWLLTIAMEAEKFTWIDDGVYYEVIIKDNTKYQISPVAIDIEEQLATKVSKTGAETIEGIKTFASSPLVPTPTSDMQAATKKYADDILSSSSRDLIGAIGYDAEAPTPGMTGKYVFSSAGLCTWMTGGAIQVDVGDEVLVLFTEPDIYAYTHLKLSQSYTSEIYRLEEEAIDRTFKTLNIGTGGLVSFSPTTRYFTYRLNVQSNLTLNIDLHRMIEQVGNARCRLIIDMPVVKTIVLTNPILWGGTVPTFSAAGQYIFEIIDVDGSGTPLIWQVASTTKAQTTGVILYVDSAGADYSVGQINGETATRTTSTWASPFKYLQNAINAASAGDIIFVKAGVYRPTHLRTTPTSYTDGDHLLRDATFSQKAGVDVYGGFLGTETKTWQRVVDADGLPVNKTIFSGDILREAAIDPAKTVGDRRTDASKANAAYNVVYANVANYTYLNGVEVTYGFANGASAPTERGGGVWSANNNLVISDCTITGNTATSGGGTHSGTVTNCTITGNTATDLGGGTYASTVTNCTITGNTATDLGGGASSGTVTNCTITGNTATYGGGTYASTVTNCTITGNTATYGGGTRSSTVTNCTITGNTATYGGGTRAGTVTNCIITGNTATYGSGTRDGTVTNCTITGNKGDQAVFGSTTADVSYNNLVFGNKNASGNTVGYDDKTATGIKIFRNNAYDTAHPTITGGAGSDIDTTTCIQNLTIEQAGIMTLSFAGVPETEEQWTELNAYISEAKARPKGVNLLKAAGINSATYPAPATDITGAARPLTPNSVTIGAYESE